MIRFEYFTSINISTSDLIHICNTLVYSNRIGMYRKSNKAAPLLPYGNRRKRLLSVLLVLQVIQLLCHQILVQGSFQQFFTPRFVGTWLIIVQRILSQR